VHNYWGLLRNNDVCHFVNLSSCHFVTLSQGYGGVKYIIQEKRECNMSKFEDELKDILGKHKEEEFSIRDSSGIHFQFYQYRQDREKGMPLEEELRRLTELQDLGELTEPEYEYIYRRKKVVMKRLKMGLTEGTLLTAPEHMRDYYRHKSIVLDIMDILSPCH
jgi:hypothetical protein